MSNPFFEKPVLNSPYAYPAQHWELDEQGQPTQRVIQTRRRTELFTYWFIDTVYIEESDFARHTNILGAKSLYDFQKTTHKGEIKVPHLFDNPTCDRIDLKEINCHRR